MSRPLDPFRIVVSSAEFVPVLEVFDSLGHPTTAHLKVDPERRRATVDVATPLDGILLLRVSAPSACDRGNYEIAAQSAVAPTPQSGPPRVLALLAGVGQDTRMGDPLPGVGRDLEVMQNLLRKTFGVPDSGLRVLPPPSRVDFIRAFHEYLGGARTVDTVIVYFSGHGTRVANTLVTGEADPEVGDGKDEVLLLRDSVLVDDELAVLLGRLQARRVIVILDSCYSGHGTRGGKGARRSGLVAKVTPELNDREAKLRLLGGLGGPPVDPVMPLRTVVDGNEALDHVVLTASDEGTVAYAATNMTRPRPSVFTAVLAAELSRISVNPDATFIDLIRAVRIRTHEVTVKAEKKPYQCPSADGQMDERIADYLRPAAATRSFDLAASRDPCCVGGNSNAPICVR